MAVGAELDRLLELLRPAQPPAATGRQRKQGQRTTVFATGKRISRDADGFARRVTFAEKRTHPLPLPSLWAFCAL